jgi:hypothetical protein
MGKRARRKRTRRIEDERHEPVGEGSVVRSVDQRLGAFYAAGPALTFGGPVQAKPTVGSAEGPLEREADAVADRVATDDAPVQAQPAPGQGKAGGATPARAASRAIGDRGGGEPLNRGTRRTLESRLGADLGAVRVHQGDASREASRELGARAFTHRDHIWLGPGASQADTRLMAHEVAHVMQQRGMAGAAPAIMRDVDKGHYYPDRGGAVARGRKLQQSHMKIEVFQRPDKNWQVRYSNPVPVVKSFPHVDKGMYYKDKGGAEVRARKLRAYGFGVQVFQRSDSNWQCRITSLVSSSPGVPTATGADAGFYYKRKTSAETRAEALREVGYAVEVFERVDKNWQVRVTALPTFGGTKAAAPPSGGKSPAAPPAARKKPKAAPPSKAPPAAKATPKSTGPPQKLVVINASDPDKKKLSDAVAQSYRDFVVEVKGLTGQDLALDFGDTVRALSSKPSKKDADTVSWHKTGRAVDINQGLKWVIREDPHGGKTFFRLYLRHKDKAAAAKGNVVRFSKGTDFFHNPYGGDNVFKWSFVDVTAIAAKHGWKPIPAHKGWRTNWDAREWWHFDKREGKSWYEALAEIYTEKDIVSGIKGFASGTEGANEYGARLKREGVPDDVLKKIFSPVTEGGVTLLLPVGEGRKAANRTEDVKAVQEALIKAKLLTGAATGVYDADTKKALIKFQKDEAGLSKPDGRVDVEGTTHKKLGAVK